MRIHDNQALNAAITQSNIDGQTLCAIHILDEINKRAIGGASKWFLHKILEDLSKNLRQRFGCQLSLFKGDSLEVLEKIFTDLEISEIYVNNNFEPQSYNLIQKIAKLSEKNAVKFSLFEANLLFSPGEIVTGAGYYFKVFTPFWKKCLSHEVNISKDLKPISLNKNIISDEVKQYFTKESLSLDELKLLPKIAWNEKMQQYWKISESDALQQFDLFLKSKINNYKKSRDFPGLEATSTMSPFLHFGLISVRHIFNKVRLYQVHNNQLQNKDINHFLSEIGWREFSYNLLHNFPQLPQKNFNAKFDKFSWYENDDILQKWQKGQTGYPIVDAGMRQLYQTGWMHNRVRMIVGSFLVKDLLIDWRQGEKWFWDCLVDADMASNVASWQWIAGSGADAAPYFRIFNPTLQSQRFDPQGDYIRKWVPELSKLSNKLIHEPSTANMFELEEAGIKLGQDYPHPMVDHKKARDMAMMIYKSL